MGWIRKLAGIAKKVSRHPVTKEMAAAAAVAAATALINRLRKNSTENNKDWTEKN
jgi:hypothetical protein